MKTIYKEKGYRVINNEIDKQFFVQKRILIFWRIIDIFIYSTPKNKCGARLAAYNLYKKLING